MIGGINTSEIRGVALTPAGTRVGVAAGTGAGQFALMRAFL